MKHLILTLLITLYTNSTYAAEPSVAVCYASANDRSGSHDMYYEMEYKTDGIFGPASGDLPLVGGYHVRTQFFPTKVAGKVQLFARFDLRNEEGKVMTVQFPAVIDDYDSSTGFFFASINDGPALWFYCGVFTSRSNAEKFKKLRPGNTLPAPPLTAEGV